MDLRLPSERLTSRDGSCRPRHQLFKSLFGVAFASLCITGLTLADRVDARGGSEEPGVGNQHPVHLVLPPVQPLSAVARLGKQLFFDPALSASGRQSCASCHSPAHAYSPPNALSVQPGGADLKSFGGRPPPSLTYLYRQAPFSIGPDTGPDDVAVNLNTVAAATSDHPRAQKAAGVAHPIAMVPQGGLFWDGRADSLQRQAFLPALNPLEMANAGVADIAHELDQVRYRKAFTQLFGPTIFNDADRLVSEAMFAIGRYQIEDPSFHAFTSKYDAWLQGKARLSTTEARGLKLFNDPKKGNCAACHLSQVGKDGLPPLFTDTQYEALAVPRNPHLAQNRDPGFFDLGLCGPIRKDLARQTQYCGMFLTPTLRNADRRSAFFHNGVYSTLKQVLDFYNLRSVQPEKIYPRDRSGHVAVYNDLPKSMQANVDTTDAPFDRHPGDATALTALDIDDIIAFIHTLDDGYAPMSQPTTR